jgi:amino acid permease
MTLFRIVTRTGLTGLAVLLAVTVPHFARVVSFVGALFSFAVSGAFPSLFFLKLMPEAHPCEKALNVLIVALSIVCTIAGVYGSIWSPNP